ncbi:MAG: cell division protein FtsQ/DivIB [Geobacteraceae bacterium]|nr:cell division protein FtsQ/DivIB [Geobacteraceae bacterium]
MRDLSTSKYQRNKVAANKVKIKRKPIEWQKYLRPLAKICLVLVCASLLFGVLYAGYRAFGATTFFRLKNIEVSRAKHLSREEILALTGAEAGQDLARMDLKRMGEQLSQNPWVETVHIHRYLPDRLSITFAEREPVAIVNMGYIYYLDKNGTVFKALNQGDKLDYPVVTGFSEEDLNSDPAGTGEALKTTCELLKILQEKGAFILADVSEIHYDKGYGFTLFTASGGLPVKVGSGDFTAKIDRFARIYRDLMVQRAALQYIDLDYNDKIVVKKS